METTIKLSDNVPIINSVCWYYCNWEFLGCPVASPVINSLREKIKSQNLSRFYMVSAKTGNILEFELVDTVTMKFADGSTDIAHWRFRCTQTKFAHLSATVMNRFTAAEMGVSPSKEREMSVTNA